MGCPDTGGETSTQQSRGRRITPLGSRITVFPRGSGPRTLRMCVYLVCIKLIRGAQPRSDCSTCVYVILCLDPRTVTGETFCLVLRPAHPASCIVSHDVFKWSTTAVSSSSDRVPDHLTVGRNLHMKDAGTITSHPGGASGFRSLDGEFDTWCRTVVTVLLSNPSCELGSWERRPRTTARNPY